MADLRKAVKDELKEQEKNKDTVAEENPKLPFDPTAEVDAAYVKELRDCGSKWDGGRAASPARHRHSHRKRSKTPPSKETAMAAWDWTGALPWEGKWRTPNHIAKLAQDTVDYDWWFRQMRDYLDDLRITQQSLWIGYYRVHCDRDFLAEIRDRLLEDEVDPSRVLSHPHKFQEYVCFRFTPATYPAEVMQRLLATREKSMDPKPAWLEVSKLVFCYNEFMRRRKGTLITDLQYSYHFAHALKQPVFEFLYDLLEQGHPKVRTPRRAYGVALRHVRGRMGRKKRAAEEVVDEEEDRVMTAQTGNEKKGRGRRAKGGVKKEGKNAAMIAATPATTTSMANVPPPPPPPPPPPSATVPAATAMATVPAAKTSAETPAPPQEPVSKAASSFSPRFQGGAAARWTPPAGTCCRICGRNDHWMAQCPDRFQQYAARGSGGARPPLRPTYPSCPYCGRNNHPGERCWTQFPYLRPRQPGPPPVRGPARPQQANLAVASWTAAASQTGTTATAMGNGSASTASASEVATPMTRWDHVADSSGVSDAVFMTAEAKALRCTDVSAAVSSNAVQFATSTPLSADRGTNENVIATSSTAYVCLTPRAAPENFAHLSLCRCLLRVETEYGGRPFRMVVDTGATVNLVRRDRLEVTAEPVEVEVTPVTTVTGATQHLRQQVTLMFDLNTYPYIFDFYVTDQLPADAILGLDAIIEAGWVIDIFRRCLYHLNHALPPVPLAPCPHTVTLAYAAAAFSLPPQSWKRVPVRVARDTMPSDAVVLRTPSPPLHMTVHGAPTVMWATAEQPCVLLCNYGTQVLRVEEGSPLAYEERCEIVEAAVNEKQERGRQSEVKGPKKRVLRAHEVFDLAQAQANWKAPAVGRLKSLLHHWRHVWDNQDIVGRTSKWEHRVDTGTAPPITQPMRRVAWVEKDTIQKEVDKMRAQNVIVESDSPWSSPPVLVKKKDGTIRFCIDYRRLNDVTVPDSYPLPRIDDVLDALEQGRFFSVIDLKSGYWQIPMRQEDAAKTAFRTAEGLFQFTVMPFGLRNAPATFQRLMDVIFSGLKWQGLLVYLDDIIVYSRDEERHLLLLEQVLSRLSDAGLKLNPKKTTLVSREVNYLGHVVSAEGVKPDPKKVRAVMQLAAPTTVREVRAFLGLAGYYRRFIDAFAAIAAPLYALTKKNARFEWGEGQQMAFEQLKKRLCETPILAYPRRERPFILDCDASDGAAGAVLTQVDEKGQEVVVQYASYTFTGAEQRWPIMEKEAYAVVWSMNVFRSYLLGRPFTVRTDNSATSFLKQARQPKLQRWAVALSEYSYTVQHRPGKLHSHVDALSRLPVEGERESRYDLEVPNVVMSAFLAGEVVARHASLPSVDWATACAQDDECVFLRGYVSGVDTGRPMPQWFRNMSNQERARFLVQRPYVVFRGFPPRDRPRWFVPERLRRAVVAAYHRGAQGAHLGISKMTRQLTCHFYWPNMVSTVKSCVRACERCQRVKAAPRIAKASRLLNRAALWSTVAFDFFGPLPRTQRGNIYILVGIDHFSRWPEAVSTRVATSQVVADFLHTRIISQHGTPRELLTDHGTPFVSHVIAGLCRRYGVRRLMSTPYTPQSNGIVERFMGYLKNALITLIDQKPKSWDEHVSAVLFAYRATPHPETGESPFFLNKGYDPVVPELRALEVPSEQIVPSGWHDTLQATRETLEQMIIQKQEAAAAQSASSKDRLAVGQLVLVKRTPTELQQSHTKLTDKFDHISRVLSVLPSGVVYKVQPLGGGDTMQINRRNLRPFFEDTELDDVDVLSPPRLPLPIL